MPTYEYACTQCGGFTAVRPLAEFRDPQPCPKCAAPSPRVTMTSPSFKGLFPRSAPESPAPSARATGCYHGMGCNCC